MTELDRVGEEVRRAVLGDEHVDRSTAAATEFTAPTLVIGGEHDPATPPEAHAKLIAEGIPGARLEIVPDAAHLANVEQPDVVNRLLLEFLGGVA